MGSGGGVQVVCLGKGKGAFCVEGRAGIRAVLRESIRCVRGTERRPSWLSLESRKTKIQMSLEEDMRSRVDIRYNKESCRSHCRGLKKRRNGN